MVEIITESDKVIFGMPGWEWNLKKRLEFPLDHIAGAHADPYIAQVIARNWVNRRNFLNAYVPGLLRAGAVYEDGDCIFWEVHNPEKTIIVYLEDEPFAKLIIEVNDPAAAISLIEKAISTPEPTS